METRSKSGCEQGNMLAITLHHTPTESIWFSTNRTAIIAFICAVIREWTLPTPHLDFNHTLAKLVEVVSACLVDGVGGAVASRGGDKSPVPWFIRRVDSLFPVVDPETIVCPTIVSVDPVLPMMVFYACTPLLIGVTVMWTPIH